MAHLEANCFLKYLIKSIEPYYKKANVLEIGSYDVNGTVRSSFNDYNSYVGIDLIPGPSVDIVCSGHLYNSVKKYDIVLSVESFEHNSHWKETFNRMVELTNDSGIVIITCATKGRLEHGTYRTDQYSSPGTSTINNSYYRNLNIFDFNTISNFKNIFITHDFFINSITRDLYFYGLKGETKIDAKCLSHIFQKSTLKAANERKKTNLKAYLKLRFLYLLLSPLYNSYSDLTYQNITYLPYKNLRRLFKFLKLY